MAFVEIEVAKIDKVVGGLCKRRNRPEFKDELSLEYRVRGQDVLIFERRARWDGRPGFTETPVAKISFTRTTSIWHLYWMRDNGKWHSYEPKPVAGDLSRLVSEVDADPLGCFFG